MTILTRGADRLLELHAAELPQKDELCGCFWATLALRLHGEGPSSRTTSRCSRAVRSRVTGTSTCSRSARRVATTSASSCR